MCDVLQIDYSDEEVKEYNDRVQKLIFEPFNHLIKAKSKNIRDKMCKFFNYWFEISDEELQKVVYIVSRFHNFSLLIDDIQDNSLLRRGVPTAHVIYGIGRTFVVANHVSVETALTAFDDCKCNMKDEITKTAITAVKGQIMDTYWRDNFVCPTEEEYIDMIVLKTGCIFQLGIKLMKAVSNKNEDDRDFTTALNLISIYFQILDDYYNLQSDIYYSTKGFCEDLTEGKFSYPIIHGVNSNLKDRRIYNIVKQQTTDVELKKECLKLLEEHGSFEYTRKKLATLRKDIEFELDKVGGHRYLNEFFDVLSGKQGIDL